MPDALSPWLDKMMPRLPGALVNVARDELILAMSEFFRESVGWVEEIGPYTLPAGTEQFSFNPVDANRKVIHILGVYINDTPIAWAGTGTPGDILIKHAPANDMVDALTAKAALAPADPAAWLPELVTAHYFDAVLDSALGRMYMHPLKPYTSDQLARFHLKRARSRTREAREVARRSFNPDAIPWSFPHYGV